MKIFRLVSFSIMLLVASMVQAADRPVLDVYIPSSNSGNSWVEGNMIRDALVNLGYDSEVVWTKNCQGTIKLINAGGARPGIFVRSSGKLVQDEKKGCTGLTVDEKSFVMPFYVRLQTMCVRKDVGFTTLADFLQGKERITIATPVTIPGGNTVYTDLTEQTGVNFVRVSYDGSKKVLQGLIAGDTDLLYSGYTKREYGNSEIQCFTTSAETTINGLTPMQTIFPTWKFNTLGNYKYIHAVELPEERFQEVRDAVSKVIDNDPKVAPYIRNANMVPGTEITDGLNKFYASVDAWRG